MSELTVIKSSHNFVVKDFSNTVRHAILRYTWNYTQYDWQRENGQWRRIPIKDWYVHNRIKNTFRFHINTWHEFCQHLSTVGIKREHFTIIENPRQAPEKAEYPIRPNYIPRPDQLEDVDFLDNPNKYPNLLLQAQTGAGKTLMSLLALKRRGVRLAIVVKPGYISKWLDDIVKHTLIKTDRCYVVQGGDGIEESIQLVRQDRFDADVMIISNVTLAGWYREIETNPEFKGYGIEPDDYFEYLGVGVRLMDEVHQSFHMMFRIDLYTNVDEAISISAEIDGDNDFQNAMAAVAYPKHCRTKRREFHRYVNTVVNTYCFRNPHKIRYQTPPPKRFYNHIKLEESIMRHVPTLQNYMKMILELSDELYKQEYCPKDKLVIFVASIAMATKLTQAAKQFWRGKDVRRYVEKDPLENLMGGDVTITTLLSGGTGHDIPNLSTAYLTHSVMATQSNIQGFGRLRFKEGAKRKFGYLVCKDIPKQLEYDQSKRQLLSGRTLTLSQTHYPYLI